MRTRARDRDTTMRVFILRRRVRASAVAFRQTDDYNMRAPYD